MNASLDFVPGGSDGTVVCVDHNEHDRKTPKRLLIVVGCDTIEIKTTGDGLNKIAQAITDHPEAMKKLAEAEFKAAKQKLESFGPQVMPVEDKKCDT